MGLHFDDAYREVARLRDGTEVVLRAVHPDDKERLRAGFLRLSPQSRYLRFHGSKTDLTDAELRYLTELDGVRHFAIGAVRAADGEEGLGIARVIRLDGEPGVAEVAVTVLDELQGKGLGTLLLQRAVAAAAERGIARIRCLVLGSNHAMQDLVHKLGEHLAAHATVEAGVVTIELELPDVRVDAPAEEAPRDSGVFAILRLAAERVLGLARGD